jgi:hypothetical protein
LRFGSCSFFAKRRCTGLNPKSETRLGCYTPTKKVIARKVRFRLLFADFGVVDFVAVAPLQFTAVHHVSTRGFQTAQNKSLGITEFQQISTSIEIWFGTRGSEVQILSPRPINSNYLLRCQTHRGTVDPLFQASSRVLELRVILAVRPIVTRSATLA